MYVYKTKINKIQKIVLVTLEKNFIFLIKYMYCNSRSTQKKPMNLNICSLQPLQQSRLCHHASKMFAFYTLQTLTLSFFPLIFDIIFILPIIFIVLYIKSLYWRSLPNGKFSIWRWRFIVYYFSSCS